MAAHQLRLLVIEKHPVVRTGLSCILQSQSDMALTSEARSAEEALARLRLVTHDIILTDLRTPLEMDIRSLHEAAPRTKIIIFTDREGDVDILRAINAGAAGYLLKNATREEILESIRNVAQRDRFLPPAIAQRLADQIGMKTLTSREIEVLEFVREGWRNRQIAIKLAVAEATVNFHIKNSMAKLAANDRTHAVMIAMRRGLLASI